LQENKIKKISYFLLPSLVGAIVPIITLPIFTRKISVQEYGIYALCIAYGSFISGIANMGLTIGYEREYFEQKTEKNHGELLFSVVATVTCACFILGSLTVLFSQNISSWLTRDFNYGSSFVLAHFAVSLSSIKMYFLLYLKNIGNAKSYAWFSIDEVILNMLIGMILVIYFDLGINGILLGQLIGAALVLILLLIRFSKLLPMGLNINLIKECLKISLPLTPRIFVGVIGTQFDKYLLSLLGSLGGVGLYNLGQKIAYVVFNYMTALQNVYSPNVYKMMFEQGNDDGGRIGKYLTLPFFLSTLGGLLVSLFSNDILYFLTPPSYHGASNIISILSIMYVLYFFGKQPQLIYAKKTGIISFLTMVTIFVNVIVNIHLIKIAGEQGAAYGSLLTALLTGIVGLWVSQKYFRILWEWKKILYSLTLLTIFSACSMLMREIGLSILYSILIKLIFVLLFLYSGVLLNILNIKLIRQKLASNTMFS
jgi:O-antigen/teichoic acid export membrane protein